MPPRMYNNGVEVAEGELPECFADHFEDKIKSLVNNVRIDPNVYNGSCKVEVAEENFMTSLNILRAVKSIKMKNCEGKDRIIFYITYLWITYLG